MNLVWVFSLPDQTRLLLILVCCRGSSSQATMRVWTPFILTCWRCSTALRSVSHSIDGLTLFDVVLHLSWVCLGHSSYWPSNKIPNRIDFYGHTSWVFSLQCYHRTAPFIYYSDSRSGASWASVSSASVSASLVWQGHADWSLISADWRDALLISHPLIIFWILSEILRLRVLGGS